MMMIQYNIDVAQDKRQDEIVSVAVKSSVVLQPKNENQNQCKINE